MIDSIKDFERFKLDSNYIKHMNVLFGTDEDGRVFVLELLKEDYPYLYDQFSKSYKKLIVSRDVDRSIILINYCTYSLYAHISKEIKDSNRLEELRTSLKDVLYCY